MDDSFTSKIVVNNEYDYSNILPTVDAITYLVQYCDEMNKQLTKLVEEDEEKNKQFKQEYKEYMYKKSYNNITCKDYSQFMSAVQGGNLNEIRSMNIKLCMDFYRGKGDNLEEYENSFIISFKPYEITFARKSNHNDQDMNQIEQQINDILKQFPVANCIFCNKQDNN